MRSNIWLSLAIGLSFQIMLPNLRLVYFAPAFIYLLYSRKEANSLIFCLLIGVISDLFSAYTPFGLYVLVYLLAYHTLRVIKHFFFFEELISLPILSYIFSMITTLYLGIFIQSSSKLSLFSLSWIFSDLFLYPLIDALYAFLFHAIPLHYLVRIHRKIHLSRRVRLKTKL